MQLSEATKLNEIKQINQAALRFCVDLQTNKKPALDKTY